MNLNYESARKALANAPLSWGDAHQRDKQIAQNEAMAFLLTDIAQSLSNIASALHSIDTGRSA